MVNAYLVFLGLVVCERGVEVLISRRNAAWAFQRGGVEYGVGHFRWMQRLHVGFLVACAAEVIVYGRRFYPLLGTFMVGAVVAAQVLRYWAVVTLGRRWNVRVIVVPDLPAVTNGPYRYVRHPNYVAVVIEGIAVPMVHTAWATALAFSALNAVLLAVRIRCEERALAAHCGYEERMAHRPRFLPRRSRALARRPA